MTLHPTPTHTDADYEAALDLLQRLAVNAATDWLEAHFGERCPEPSDSCECCRRWKLFDELFAEVDE